MVIQSPLSKNDKEVILQPPLQTYSKNQFLKV